MHHFVPFVGHHATGRGGELSTLIRYHLTTAPTHEIR
ncbi:hypothetical protein FOXYSP1_19916 [Fusarium oxysporum f. sp. phaseoli]